MLIYKGPVAGDVVTIKLTSGEELVALLDSEQPTTIRISKPKVLIMGKDGLGMAPYLFTVDPDQIVNLARPTIVVLEKTDAQYSKQYISATSSIVI